MKGGTQQLLHPLHFGLSGGVDGGRCDADLLVLSFMCARPARVCVGRRLLCLFCARSFVRRLTCSPNF